MTPQQEADLMKTIAIQNKNMDTLINYVRQLTDISEKLITRIEKLERDGGAK